MTYALTTATKRIANCRKRYVFEQGGGSASKTISTLILLISVAQIERNKIITVATDTFPALRTGAMRDFEQILETQQLDNQFTVSKTTSTWRHVQTGTKIEFVALDDPRKARGPRRDYLFINEANRITFKLFEQLAMRTRARIYCDWNPVKRFWANDYAEKHPDLVDFLVLTFKDNEALSADERNAILELPRNSNSWRVYGLGQIGVLEGNIYQGWERAENTDGFHLENYGLDFGFGHPNALVGVWRNEDEWLFEERLYENNLLTSDLVGRVKSIVGDYEVICDSARPEIIADLRNAGVRAIPADKGQGSVARGLGEIQNLKVKYIGNNIEKEFLSYEWRKKADGTSLDEPVKINDDAMDAIRYAVDDIINGERAKYVWASAEDLL